MTITLVPENEVHLRQRAAQDGKDIDAVANALLANVLHSTPLEDTAKEDALDRALLAAGLITHIPPPRDLSKAERPRITVLGESVSETILRERR